MWRGNIFLLIAALIWGGAFVPQRTSMGDIGPFSLIGFRFILGSIALIPLIIYRYIRPVNRPIPSQKTTYAMVGGGILAGLLLFISSALQQIGLQSTTAGKAGFITSLYVVVVPLLGLLWGQKTDRFTWGGIILAAIGLYFLTITEQLTIEYGDFLVILCAISFAIYIQLIDYLIKYTDPIHLAAIQFLITGILGLVTMVAIETVTWQGIQGALPAILYLGLLSSGVGFTLQIVGQQYAHPANASMIMSLEGPFALLAGWLLLGETLGIQPLIGCGLMLIGIVVSQYQQRP